MTVVYLVHGHRGSPTIYAYELIFKYQVLVSCLYIHYSIAHLIWHLPKACCTQWFRWWVFSAVQRCESCYLTLKPFAPSLCPVVPPLEKARYLGGQCAMQADQVQCIFLNWPSGRNLPLMGLERFSKKDKALILIAECSATTGHRGHLVRWKMKWRW